MKKDLNIIKDIFITHRGLHDKCIPENSLGAFKAAINKNLPIELDIHLLKDKKVVVFHDDNLKRMTGKDLDIDKVTYDEIKNLRLGDSNEKLPLLKEVLELVNGKVLLDIELKITNPAGKLEKELVKLLDNYNGKFIVKSFNPLSVLWFRINRPKYIRGQLSCSYTKEKMNSLKRYILRDLVHLFITKPDFVAYDIKSITDKIVKKLKKRNIPLILWTIRNKEELDKAKSYNASIVYEKIII